MCSRKEITIPVQPWFRDHHFNGIMIFPAVEIMLLLAGIASKINSAIYPETMTKASFSKFLEIPQKTTELSALVEYEEKGADLCIRLLSRIQFKKISRIKEHAEITFSTRKPAKHSAGEEQTMPTQTELSMSAEQIYRELVPFGPAYRSLTGNLHISNKAALGTLQAPVLPRQQRMEKNLGSPFPLDGAMHAACVLGQYLADFVPFPVGFARRHIHKPTRHGKSYKTIVTPVSQTKDELLFNISILDSTETVCEKITGLRMRDISGGTITPPAELPKLTFSPQ